MLHNMLITTIFYESHPFTCRGGFTTWHMRCFVRDVCTIRQFSTAPFFLQYFLIDFGFHRLSMCCELFPRIGFQITAIRYIGAHPGDLFGSDGTPSHTPGTQPVRQHMAYVSFRTASSIWLGQGFMDTLPVRHDVLIAVPDGFFPLGTLPQFSLYFFHESFAVIGFQRLIQGRTCTFACNLAEVLTGMVSIDHMSTVPYVLGP